MSSGLVVAASNICDNAAIIENGINGYLFNPRNYNDIAHTINDMLSLNKEDKIKISRKAREYAVSHLSINSFVDKYISLIKKIVD